MAKSGTVRRLNRRTSRRQHPKRTTKIICRSGTMNVGPNLALSLLDISENGARILCRVPFPIGQIVTVEIEGLWVKRPIVREAEVVWCIETADGKHCAGLRIEQRLDYNDFQSLVYI